MSSPQKLLMQQTQSENYGDTAYVILCASIVVTDVLIDIVLREIFKRMVS